MWTHRRHRPCCPVGRETEQLGSPEPGWTELQAEGKYPPQRTRREIKALGTSRMKWTHRHCPCTISATWRFASRGHLTLLGQFLAMAHWTPPCGEEGSRVRMKAGGQGMLQESPPPSLMYQQELCWRGCMLPPGPTAQGATFQHSGEPVTEHSGCNSTRTLYNRKTSPHPWAQLPAPCN